MDSDLFSIDACAEYAGTAARMRHVCSVVVEECLVQGIDPDAGNVSRWAPVLRGTWPHDTLPTVPDPSTDDPELLFGLAPREMVEAVLADRALASYRRQGIDLVGFRRQGHCGLFRRGVGCDIRRGSGRPASARFVVRGSIR